MGRRFERRGWCAPLLVLVTVAVLLGGCAKKETPKAERPEGPRGAPSEAPAGEAAPATPVHFVDVAAEAGLDGFRHGGSADASVLTKPIPREALTPEFVRSKLAGFLGSGLGFADYDNDGDPDLYLVNCGPDEASSRNALYRNNGDGTFTDVTAEAGAQDDGFTIAAVFADYDHDGDLDLYLVNYIDLERLPDKAQLRFPDDFPGAENLLLQNDGSGRFHPTTEETHLGDGGRRGRAAVFADITINNAVDLFLVNEGEPVQVRISSWDGTTWDGTFSNIAPEGETALSPTAQGLALADFDNDGRLDAYITTGPGEPDILLNPALPVRPKDRPARFSRYQASPGLFDATVQRLSTGVAFIDYNNDGGKDILTVGEDVGGAGAPTVLLFANQNDGNPFFNKPPTFRDVSAEAGLTALGSPRCRGLSVADYDLDGDLDVAVQVNGGRPLLLRNEGGNRNHWFALRLRGVHGRDNRSGIGTKVLVSAGPIKLASQLVGANGYQSADLNVLHFGLAQHPTADVRITWPQGYVQELKGVQADQLLAVAETTAAKPSSCPLVFAWDGERYRFVSDTLGSVLLGAIQPDGSTFSLLDTDEYLKIPGERLKPKDGYWSIIFSDRLRETAYLDRAKLLVVDHPAEVVFYCNERLSSRPPYPEFKLFTSRTERLPVSAVREDGTDILAALSKVDRVYAPHGEPLNYEGIVRTHSYILDLGDLSGYRHPVLVLYGWSDFATVNARYAAGQAGIKVLPVTLYVKDASGEWKVAIEDIGEPGGWPKPQTVDLAGLFETDDYHIKITTNIAMYYDRITVIDYDPSLPVRVTEMEPDRAELVQAGFASTFRPDGHKPDLFDHERMMPFNPWNMFCFGKHTRYGDIRPLLLATDDMYAVMAPGDEAVIDFEAAKAPPLPEGWVRDFVFYADGFMKDIRFRVAYACYVEPLPFHGMSAYPPPPGESYPMDEEHRRYLQTYNTREITPSTGALVDAYTFGFQEEGGLPAPGR